MKTLKLFFFLLIISVPSFGQIIFKELPRYEIKLTDSLFFNITSKRNISSLNGNWEVYSASNPDKGKASVSVPSLFSGEAEVVFEKRFNLTSEQIRQNRIKLTFFGLNYSAEIAINDIIIYRHTGGEFPFSVELAKDILSFQNPNLLSVKLLFSPDAKNTIPVKQQFLFPQRFGGIVKDVFLQLIPNVSIAGIKTVPEISSGVQRGKISIQTRIENRLPQKTNDTLEIDSQFRLKTELFTNNYEKVTSLPDVNVLVKKNQESTANQTIEISNPALWSMENPQSYILKSQLYAGDFLIDEFVQSVPLYVLEVKDDYLTFNNNEFKMKGVTYIPSFGENGLLASYAEMERDIKLIKETGFNTIRFTKVIPHPYLLRLCELYGLFAFIELPLNRIPEVISNTPEFTARSKNYLYDFLRGYKRFPVIAGIGLGSSYLPESFIHQTFISDLAAIVKSETNVLTYASFTGADIAVIENIDLYGVEIFETPLEKYSLSLNELIDVFPKGKLFISEISYVTYEGKTNGYVNARSLEAQAKYFNDFLGYIKNINPAGFFINTMFDYRGNYASLVTGYNELNLYSIGILGEDRDINRLTHHILKANLTNADLPTIPIGSKSDDSPMLFILTGLGLAIIFGLLINTGRKFREDAKRALLRPYNFFADVRDQRLVSGLHSALLAIIIAGTNALVAANLLYFFRYSESLEKFILALGWDSLITAYSFLAWNPIDAIFYLFIISLLIIVAVSVFVKAVSLAVRNRVFFSNCFYAVVWSHLPVVLLIPLGLVLFRILEANILNIYLYAGLILYSLMIFHRMMKGIYVIFDVSPGRVYFWTFFLLLVFAGSFLLYAQISNSAIEYVIHFYKETKIH